MYIGKHWYINMVLCNLVLHISYTLSWIEKSSFQSLIPWSSPVWTTAMHSTWGYLGRVFGSYSWVQWAVQAVLSTSRVVHVTPLLRSYSGCQFAPRFNSKSWHRIGLPEELSHPTSHCPVPPGPAGKVCCKSYQLKEFQPVGFKMAAFSAVFPALCNISPRGGGAPLF